MSRFLIEFQICDNLPAGNLTNLRDAQTLCVNHLLNSLSFYAWRHPFTHLEDVLSIHLLENMYHRLVTPWPPTCHTCTLSTNMLDTLSGLLLEIQTRCTHPGRHPVQCPPTRQTPCLPTYWPTGHPVHPLAGHPVYLPAGHPVQPPARQTVQCTLTLTCYATCTVYNVNSPALSTHQLDSCLSAC